MLLIKAALYLLTNKRIHTYTYTHIYHTDTGGHVGREIDYQDFMTQTFKCGGESRLNVTYKKPILMEFSGGPVVRTPHFHCQGPVFDPWSRNSDSIISVVRSKGN